MALPKVYPVKFKVSKRIRLIWEEGEERPRGWTSEQSSLKDNGIIEPDEVLSFKRLYKLGNCAIFSISSDKAEADFDLEDIERIVTEEAVSEIEY